MKPFQIPLHAALLLAPAASSAATISRIVADLDALATFTPGGGSTVTDFDEATALIDGLQSVEAFVPGGPFRFEGEDLLPTGGFASAEGDAFGNLGVGVNSFFLRTSPIPNVSTATFVYEEDILNDTDEVVTLGASVFVPAPEIRLRGQISDVGAGPVPAFIPEAEVSAKVITSIARLDGSFEDVVHLDYGLSAARDPTDGDFKPALSRDARGLIEEEGFFGDFRYRLAELDADFDAIATLAPGESVKISMQYFARGSNGVGETGYFAAIGDPFDIAGGGGSFRVTQAGDGVGPPPVDPPPVNPPPPPPSAVPLPASLPLLGLSLAVLVAARRRGGAAPPKTDSIAPLEASRCIGGASQ